MTARILAFAGSLRKESFNRKLVPIAAKGARDAGALVTLIGLEDFPLPLFDQDLEARQRPCAPTPVPRRSFLNYCTLAEEFKVARRCEAPTTSSKRWSA